MSKPTAAAKKARHFELIAGTSAKFWEIEPIEDGYRVRYGKVETKGQTRDKTFPDVEAAHAAIEKIIAEKLEEGYVEVAAHRS